MHNSKASASIWLTFMEFLQSIKVCQIASAFEFK